MGDVLAEYKRNLVEKGFARCYEPWTSEEDMQLLKAFDAGNSIRQLSKTHQRTVGAIRSRLVKVGRIKEDEERLPASPANIQTLKSPEAEGSNDPDDRALFEKHWELVEYLICQGMRRLDILLPKISRRDHELMIEYMGTRDGERKTLAEVAAKFDISRERVRQVRSKVTDKLVRRLISGRF